MPVVEDSDGVVRCHAVRDTNSKGNSQGLELDSGLTGAIDTSMHGTDSQGRRGRGREHKLELAGSANDEELAQRRDEEQAEEGAAESQGEDLANIASRRARHEIESVHGRDTCNEDTSNTSGTGGSSLSTLGLEVQPAIMNPGHTHLNNGVFLRSKGSTQKWNVRLREHLQNTVSENCTKHRGHKCETSFLQSDLMSE